MLPILYSYRRCPYAMRARMALKLAEIEVEIREISLREKPAHMLQVSPKGTVPVLVLADGSVIDESLEIMYWAREQAPIKREGKLNALQPNIHEACSALILMNDNEFKQSLDRYKYPERNLCDNLKPTQQYRQQGEVFLRQLEGLLQNNTYLLESTPSMADIAIFPFVRQFAAVDSAWFDTAPYPKLRAWLNTWLSSLLFETVMKKQPTYIK